jgi:hypothetical protein
MTLEDIIPRFEAYPSNRNTDRSRIIQRLAVLLTVGLLAAQFTTKTTKTVLG